MSTFDKIQAYWQRTAATWLSLAAFVGLFLMWPGAMLMVMVLSLAVLVHEYGHYFVMRRNGIFVTEFSIGFGPSLWSTKLKSGTVFSIKPILLGGQAKPQMAQPTDTLLELPGSRWAKFKIAMAGMFVNSAVAFVTLLILIYATGMMPVILFPYVKGLPPALVPPVAAFLGSFGLWIYGPFLIVKMMVTSIGGFFASSAGPIGIIAMGQQAAASSPTLGVMALKFAWLFWMLNAALAGFNLLPILPLDGGYIPALLIDKFGGKRAAKINLVLRYAGVLLILLLIISIIGSDIIKLALGKSFPGV